LFIEPSSNSIWVTLSPAVPTFTRVTLTKFEGVVPNQTFS